MSKATTIREIFHKSIKLEVDQWEVAVYEYVQVLRKIRKAAIAKYGAVANDWFGIK